MLPVTAMMGVLLVAAELAIPIIKLFQWSFDDKPESDTKSDIPTHSHEPANAVIYEKLGELNCDMIHNKTDMTYLTDRISRLEKCMSESNAQMEARKNDVAKKLDMVIEEIGEHFLQISDRNALNEANLRVDIQGLEGNVGDILKVLVTNDVLAKELVGTLSCQDMQPLDMALANTGDWGTGEYSTANWESDRSAPSHQPHETWASWEPADSSASDGFEHVDGEEVEGHEPWMSDRSLEYE